jgi:hypothetical protein
MTSEQKFVALQSLTHGSALYMRQPGDWYVHLPNVNIKKKNILEGTSQNGKTPFDAIDQCWAHLTTGQLLVIRADCNDRRMVRWNGFMWADATE